MASKQGEQLAAKVDLDILVKLMDKADVPRDQRICYLAEVNLHLIDHAILETYGV